AGDVYSLTTQGSTSFASPPTTSCSLVASDKGEETMEAKFLPEADTLQSALRQFYAITKRGREGKEEAATQLRAALHVVEDAVTDFEGHFIHPVAQRWGYLRLLTLGHADLVTNFEGHFIYPVTQRWGYLRLLTLVSAASSALREVVPV